MTAPRGYDTTLIEKVVGAVNIPVIVWWRMCNWDHMVEGLKVTV